MSPDDLLASYDYLLPRELIAVEPLAQRDASRLMLLDRAARTIDHRRFDELPDLLRPGDLLVVNETQVIPARIAGVRQQTGGKWEGLFLGCDGEGHWRVMGQTRGRLLPGEIVELRPIHGSSDQNAVPIPLRLLSREADGVWTAVPPGGTDPLDILQRYGTVPLPPYMGRDVARPEDWQRYQTTFARTPGAIAAPTAGLHFTPELFARCAARGIETAKVTLHVGSGTFRPVSVDSLDAHQMHAEWCELPAETVAAIQRTRAAGGRVVPVGTTSVRTLESVASHGELRAWQGETALFIRPPYEFRVTDALVTNFHLPKSTLLVLVSALAGREFVLRAYEEAVRERYRFFSYGDAMLIV
ncbi:MAG: tRNA preQ1(34) S-adenosylmethionine ribosyltransferase-isomerase QueA [Planctomycetaceae bacterium]